MSLLSTQISGSNLSQSPSPLPNSSSSGNAGGNSSSSSGSTSTAEPAYTHYSHSTMGKTLISALDDNFRSGSLDALTAEECKLILLAFYKSINKRLPQLARRELNLNGSLEYYNFEYSNLMWKLHFRNLELSDVGIPSAESQPIKGQNVKVLAVEGMDVFMRSGEATTTSNRKKKKRKDGTD